MFVWRESVELKNRSLLWGFFPVFLNYMLDSSFDSYDF